MICAPRKHRIPRRPRGSEPVIHYDETPCPVPGLNGPCHVYRGAKDSAGYGHVRANGVTVKTCRYCWERAHGVIPKGMEMDHLCRVRACCNVAHLRVVSHAVNMTNTVGSGWQLNAEKQFCKRGHPFDSANTKLTKDGRRQCAACERFRKRRQQFGTVSQSENT